MLTSSEIDTNGNWSVSVPELAHNASYRITAKVKDLAGNFSSVFDNNMVLTADLETDVPLISSPTADHVTQNRKPIIKGKAEKNSTVELFFSGNSTAIQTASTNGSKKL